MGLQNDDIVDSSVNPAPPLEIPETAQSLDNFVEFGDSLALDEDPFYNPQWTLEDTPPYDGGLYSTPLSWDPPKPPYEPKQEKVGPIYTSTMNTLSPAQQEKLRNIAMPNHLQYQNQHSPNSSSSTHKSSPVLSPEQRDSIRKRKSSAEAEDDDDDDGDDTEGQPPPVKKTAHNMIEKRYRTNLNDKIAALRDSVPSLRAMKKSAKGENAKEAKEDLHGLAPAHKLNKATVLSKATEYIRHLEKRNTRLSEENASMKARISAFERLFMSGSMGFNPMSPANHNPYTQKPYMTSPNGGEPTPRVTPEGMIEVPEDIKRLHAVGQMNQQTYEVPQENYRATNRVLTGRSGWQNSGGYFGKMMVGSLAGLMILESFSEREQDGENSNSRGLFAIPTQLLGQIGRSLTDSTDISLLGYHSSSSQTLALLKVMLVFGTLLYVFIPSFFDSKPKMNNGKTQTTSLAGAPSLASSIQMRRRAWLTAIQTVWVPRHNFFLEAVALCLKITKLSLRNAIGWYGYALLTGISDQQEAARIKSWSIALDAQLAGGDVEINKSRLILTLLASSTLPDTPARLMLKALHLRVLLWEYGRAGFDRFYMFQEFAAKLVRWKWNEARQLQQLAIHSQVQWDGQDVDQLPEHLAALLKHEGDEVLVNSIGQRAYNLAFNLPTNHNAIGSSDGMDGVVDDFAIRSPLDAVAAWFSSLVLQRALSAGLINQKEREECISSDTNIALETAPIGSKAHIRALVARAVLFDSQRGANIASAIKVLAPLEPQECSNYAALPAFINTATSIKSIPDLQMSVSCAIAIAHLQRSPSPANPKSAYPIINAIRPTHLSLLGFTAAFKLMEALVQHEEAAEECGKVLERLAGRLRVWIGGREGMESELSRETKEIVVERCLAVTKICVGMNGDSSYESMSEEEAEERC